MWKEKIKHGKERKKEKKRERKEKENKTHTQGQGKGNGRLICLLSIGDKWEILKLIFNTVNYLMKHNNLSCQF